MKIAILSDSHDHLGNLSKAIDYLNEKQIELILFCGDFCSPIPVKLHFARFRGQIHAVFGNTEDRHLITKLSLTEIDNLTVHGELAELEFDGVKFALVHYPEFAKALATTGSYDVVCHGHNHTANQKKINDTIVINPGEIMGFKEDARFVIFDTDNLDKPETVFINDL